MEFILNDRSVKTDKPSGTTLLDFIRYEKHLMGTKIGCREGDCGACTVLIGSLEGEELQYISMTSCITPLANVEGKHVVTVEGLNLPTLSAVQQAFVDAGGTQCGFCTVGFIVSLTGYCISTKDPSYPEAIAAIDGNICRCTGYKSIERATADVVEKLSGKKGIDWLVKEGFIPDYFNDIRQKLILLKKQKVNSNGHGNGTKKNIVGGGTDLYVQRPEDFSQEELMSFFDRADLSGIKMSGQTCTVGAASTVTDLLKSQPFNDLFPNLKKHLKLVSSTQIRNMGTVGGNLVNASPIGDMTIYFLALNSEITLSTAKGQMRKVALRDFYKKYKTMDKTEDEFIESISFHTIGKDTYFNFEKVSKRTNLDIASVNSAIRLTLEGNAIKEIHISAGGIGPVPMYLKKTVAFLTDKQLSTENVSEAADVLESEITPISDARGSKEYKALLAKQLLFAHFIELFPKKFEMEMFA